MRILVTDDHKIVRDGLKEILGHISSVEFIDEAKDGKEALLKIEKHRYDLVLLDISLPDKSGLEVLKEIIRRNPGQHVLMLSMHPQEQYAIRALKTGASGYLNKDTASEELITAVKKITGGEKYISASLAMNLANHLNDDFTKPLHEALSEREFIIMVKISKGESLKDIGSELCISDKTVSTYRSRLMEKMHFRNNAEITQYCIMNGILE